MVIKSRLGMKANQSTNSRMVQLSQRSTVIMKLVSVSVLASPNTSLSLVGRGRGLDKISILNEGSVVVFYNVVQTEGRCPIAIALT